MKKIFTLLTIFLSSLYSYSQCNVFADDFEGGTLSAQWQFGTGTYTRNVTSTNPAQGTYSFEQTGNSSFYEGTYATFTSSQPSYISFKMRTNTTTTANGYVVIGDANINSDNGILFCYFNSTNSLRFYGSTGQNFPVNPNQWYHVEVQNINWTARTMDIYLDGNLILTSWPFRSTTATSMDRIHLFNLNAATAMYDDIIIGNPPLTGSVTNTICNNDSIVVNGTVYNANNPSGTEVFTNVGPNNCDSTVTINLTVLPAIDNTTTVSGNTVTANETGATYQWLDCDNGNAVINGETSQSFTATVTGNYAVEITVGNCVDTSACENVTVVGIDELSKTPVTIYPNPNNGVFNVVSSEQVTITIYNMLGEMVLTNVLNGGNHTLSLNSHPKGVYFVNIQQNERVTTYKMIVK
ncbi:MAG TPA: T9SS type A sorting domain-containing protein [Vicingaceae bacterium]